jgi:hypothetical protein
MKDSSVHDDLRQLSHGSTTARSYGCYDINGFRFRSTKFEAKNPHAATTNSGVVTTASASDGSITEYFGVIENIVELKFEGSKDLRVVLFYCDWFNSKLGSGVKHNKKLGLVEVNHKLRLSGYNPFVLAHQVEMVYYMSYPCRLESLEPWWIVQRVCPPGRLPIPGDEGYDECELDRTVPEAFQENDCDGAFEVDIGMALDRLDGDTGDVIVSEVRKKKRPRRAGKVMFTTSETWHGTTHGGPVAEEDDPEEF